MADAGRPAGDAAEHRGGGDADQVRGRAADATREAIAYNLLPEHKIYDWQIGYGGGGLDSGIGLIAIPSLLADLDGTGSRASWRSRTWCRSRGSRTS